MHDRGQQVCARRVACTSVASGSCVPPSRLPLTCVSRAQHLHLNSVVGLVLRAQAACITAALGGSGRSGPSGNAGGARCAHVLPVPLPLMRDVLQSRHTCAMVHPWGGSMVPHLMPPSWAALKYCTIMDVNTQNHPLCSAAGCATLCLFYMVMACYITRTALLMEYVCMAGTSFCVVDCVCPVKTLLKQDGMRKRVEGRPCMRSGSACVLAAHNQWCDSPHACICTYCAR